MITQKTRIYVAGHRGMVGSAIVRLLEKQGFESIITRTSSELDLRNQASVRKFFETEQPEAVIDAAAKVGGIGANSAQPYEFLMDNLEIQNNLIRLSFETDVKKLVFLGSSCIYPKFADQPIREDYLLTGELEPTNEGYAIAKIAGIKAIEYIRRQFGRDFVSLMPTNLYGPNDNFDLQKSHVLPAMLRKFHEAKLNQNATVQLWGSGKPLREFLHVDDLANAVFFALENELDYHLYNVGYGSDVELKELASIIQKIVGHTGDIDWDASKPDGTPKKLMDSSRFRNLGWSHHIELEAGIQQTYQWFLDNLSTAKL